MLAAVLALSATMGAGGAPAQPADRPAALLVAGAAEGDGGAAPTTQVFFSLPADLSAPAVIRLYDPETHGSGDLAPAGGAAPATVYRLYGGAGAFSAAARPAMAAGGGRIVTISNSARAAAGGAGRPIREKRFGDDPATDGRWITLAAVRAAQGEIIDGRAYFRLDVQGTGDNGFMLDVDTGERRPRRSAAPRVFAFRPTLRGAPDRPGLHLRLPEGTVAPLTVESRGASDGQLALLTEHDDLPVRAGGNGDWVSDVLSTRARHMALNLHAGVRAGDVSVAVFDARGTAVPLFLPRFMAPGGRRPTAIASARPLADCRTVAFDASRSQGTGPLAHGWDFGDGAGAPGPVALHRYAAPGRYTARLDVVEDETGPGHGDRVEIAVIVRDPPVAVPGGDVVVAPGEPVVFDGSGSRASDRPITRYLWSFGTGTALEGRRVSATFDRPGVYRAMLRVEDGADHPCNFGTALRRVTVNAAPVAVAGADRTAGIGQTLSFDGTASHDIDGNVTGHVWDMGDGTVLAGPTVSHRYAAPGLYAVTLTVTDDSGAANAAATDRLFVSVNAPPVARIAPQPRALSVGEVARLDGRGSFDPDGAILSYRWDFGDGAGGAGAVADYSWAAPGIYTVALTVADDSGTEQGVHTVTGRVIVDAAPVADAGLDQIVTAGRVRFDGRGSGDREGGIAAYEWSFGDGATGRGPTPTHLYSEPGSYTVTLTVRDQSGAPFNTARDSLQVTVEGARIAAAGGPGAAALSPGGPDGRND